MNIIIELTGECLLKCVHCSQKAHNKNPISIYLENLWGTLIPFFNQGHTFILSGGEPFIYRYIRGVIEELAKLNENVKIYSSFISRPEDSLYIPTDFEYFKNFNLTLVPSFYSLNPKIHSMITGGSLKNLMDNISILKNNNIKMEANFLPLEYNFLELEKIDLYFRENFESVNILYPLNLGRNSENNIEYLEKVKEIINRINKDNFYNISSKYFNSKKTKKIYIDVYGNVIQEIASKNNFGIK